MVSSSTLGKNPWKCVSPALQLVTYQVTEHPIESYLLLMSDFIFLITFEPQHVNDL